MTVLNLIEGLGLDWNETGIRIFENKYGNKQR